MDETLLLPRDLDGVASAHLRNVADNLQLVADLGYGDVALIVRAPDGAARVIADARPTTAVAAVGFSQSAARCPRTTSRRCTARCESVARSRATGDARRAASRT